MNRTPVRGHELIHGEYRLHRYSGLANVGILRIVLYCRWPFLAKLTGFELPQEKDS